MLVLVLENPVKLRLPQEWRGSSVEKELRDKLGYEDRSVTMEWRRFRELQKDDDRRLNSPSYQPAWWVAQNGREALDKKVEELDRERYKTALFSDAGGLYTYSGLAGRLSREYGEKVERYYPLPQLGTTNGIIAKSPRYYQEDGVRKMIEAVHSGVELPTGSGKSLMISMLCLHYGLPTVVATPTLSIAEQLFADLTATFGKKAVGKYFDSKKQADKKIVVACTKSLVRVEPSDGHLLTDWNLLNSKPVLIFDECFPYETGVYTQSGIRPIGAVANDVIKGKQIKVRSFNEVTRRFELKTVIAARALPGKDFLTRVSFTRSSILATDNHPILTENGYKSAGKLVVGDIVIGMDLSNRSSGGFTFSSDTKQVLLGSYLGDGSITKHASRTRLRVIHGADQERYLRWKASLFGAKVETLEHNGFAQTKAFRFTTKTFIPRFDFTPKKTVTNKLVEELDWRAVAIWFMDDGSRTNRMRYGTHSHQKSPNSSGFFHTESFTSEEVEMLLMKLRSMGVECKLQISKSVRRRRSYNLIRMTASGFRFLCQNIAKFIHPDLAYKLHDDFKDKVNTYIWTAPTDECHEFLVTSVEKERAPKDDRPGRIASSQLFDLEVEDNHNFVVTASRRTGSTSGVVVHNCHITPAETLAKTVLRLLAGAPYRHFLSGTMLRGDGRDIVLEGITGDIVLEIELRKLVGEGYLAKPQFIQYLTNSNQPVFKNQDALKLGRIHFGKNSKIYRHAGGLLTAAVKAGRRPLVLMQEVNQFKMLLPHLGAEVGFAFGGADAKQKKDLPERFHKSNPMEMVAAFDRGELPILAGTQAIGVGVDIKTANFIVDLVNDGSETRLRQNIGRGTRVEGGKTKFWYVGYGVSNVPVLSRQAEKRRKIMDDVYGPVTVQEF